MRFYETARRVVELKHGQPLPLHLVPHVFRLLVQLGYSSLT